MLKIKRFLGFTDGIKEPRKTKVENELSACYRYNDSLYNAVEFLCVKLLEGCYPDKQENYQYYKRNGELSKPKTLYKYYSEERFGRDRNDDYYISIDSNIIQPLTLTFFMV